MDRHTKIPRVLQYFVRFGAAAPSQLTQIMLGIVFGPEMDRRTNGPTNGPTNGSTNGHLGVKQSEIQEFYIGTSSDPDSLAGLSKL